jgi:hypothetical protein
MLFQKPIFLLLTLHVGFIYGFLYIFLEAYPISLQYDRGWQKVVAALAFVAIIRGVAVACLIILIFSLTRYRSILCRAGRVDTEERVILMIIGGVLAPIGMFWFAWTSNPHITWIPQVISGGFLGAGVLLIFLQVCIFLILTCHLKQGQLNIETSKSLTGIDRDSTILLMCILRTPIRRLQPIPFFGHG